MNMMDKIACNIVLTTGCIKRCSHCYLTDKELASKDRMSKDDVLNALAKVREICDHSKENMTVLVLEVLGGEIFALDNEYLEWFFDTLFKWKAQVEADLGVVILIPVYTNLLFKDEKNFDLLKRLAESPNIEFATTSWEYDSGRFGKGHKNQEKWLENVRRTKVKTLSVAMTKKTIDHGAKAFYDEVLDAGDFHNINMELYSKPTHERAASDSEPTLIEVENYLLELYELTKDRGWQVSPFDEIDEAYKVGNFHSFDAHGNKYTFYFMPNSEVQVSCYTLNGEHEYVDFNKDNAITDFFKQASRQEQIIATRRPSVCMSCRHEPICNGGHSAFRLRDEQDSKCSGFMALRERILAQDEYLADYSPQQMKRYLATLIKAKLIWQEPSRSEIDCVISEMNDVDPNVMGKKVLILCSKEPLACAIASINHGATEIVFPSNFENITPFDARSLFFTYFKGMYKNLRLTRQQVGFLVKKFNLLNTYMGLEIAFENIKLRREGGNPKEQFGTISASEFLKHKGRYMFVGD